MKLNTIQLEAKKQIENKINNNKYTFETICCPICNSKDFASLSEKDRYGLAYNVVVCRTCGLVYTNPRMCQDSYNEFYDNEYRKLYVGTESASKSFFNSQYNKAKKIFQFIKTARPEVVFKNLHVLEVGCGAGGILQYFKENGCEVIGVDLGSEYLKFGRDNYKLELIHGSLANVPKNFTPDIIIYSHVMEHILDLNFELSQINKICSKDTLLYIEVPGIKNIHNMYKMNSLLYFQNAHTFHFSILTLTNLLEKNDFVVLSGNDYVRCLSSPSNQKHEYVIKNDYEAVLKYLNRTEKFRFLYPYKFSSIQKKTILIIVKLLDTLKLKKPILKIFGK